MALQLSTSVRNAMLEAIETTAGTAAVLELRTGSVPANCAASDSGTLLISYTLASDWAAAASSGSKALNNTPISGTASDTGTAGHWRLKSSGGTVHAQGTITATGGGGDMTVDNTSITSGQTVNVTSLTFAQSGA